jgi:hypothetical protein
VTMAGYATALSLLWLKRICEPQIVRRGKAASVCGLTSSRVAAVSRIRAASARG